MNGETQVSEAIKVKKGGRIEQYPAVAYETEYDFLDGWCMDEGLTKEWNKSTERVTKDITLYAKVLYITGDPCYGAMEKQAFSNTLVWLQRGVAEGADYSVDLIKGKKVSFTDYEYDFATPVDPVSGTVSVEHYKGEADIYEVKWTAEKIPAGGVQLRAFAQGICRSVS
ncbi:MAG: InlB B-repeat-containing protein [Clostridia bacterium]|nr:InlB B-repeat-containing protein [Clostridia bacterium]